MSDEKGRGDGADPIILFLVGDSGVGKTSLVVRFARDEFKRDAGPASVGGTQSFTKNVRIKGDNKEFMLVETHVWDVFAGDDEPQSMAGTQIMAADGILLLYDVSNYLSFSNVSSWLAAIEENARKDCLIMMVGNKADLADDCRAVSASTGSSLAEERGMAYVETSALTGTDVGTAFRLMVQECHNVQRGTADKEIKLKKRKKKKKKLDHEGEAKKKPKKRNKSEGGGATGAAVSRQSASSLLASRKAEKRVRVKLPETDSKNMDNAFGGFAGSTLSGRTASSLLAARIQAKHEKYKRKGKRAGKVGVDLDAISEGSRESSSVGPSPDVLAAVKREFETGDEEDDEACGEGRSDDAAAEIEEGVGTRIQAELVPDEDQRSILPSASNHDESSHVHPLADRGCAPSHEETKDSFHASSASEARCDSDDRTPPAKDGAPSEIEEGGRMDVIIGPELIGITHDAQESPSEIVEALDSSILGNLADSLDDDASGSSGTNRILQIQSQTVSSAQPTASLESAPDLKNTTIDKSSQSARDEELGAASPAIVGATLVEGERESKKPDDDASESSGVNKILQVRVQTTSSAQPTASSLASAPELKNATIDKPIQSTRDEELGAAYPAIVGAVEGERESKMSANDATSYTDERAEVKSTGAPRWRLSRCLLLVFLFGILILVAGAVAAWIVFVPRPTNTATSSIDVPFLSPSASPSVSTISETTGPTQQTTSTDSTRPTTSKNSSCIDDDADCESGPRRRPTAAPTFEPPTDSSELESKAPSRASLRPTARPSTDWPTVGPTELTSNTPTKVSLI